jgi:hypothetical protein
LIDPSEDAKLLDIHVQDAIYSGRPKNKQIQLNRRYYLKSKTDRYGREKTCSQIATEVRGISDTIV